MATTYLSPIGNEVQVDANGNPLSGGKIFTYQAGTTNPIATYTDNAGAVAQQNPITLNSAGLPASPIWLPAGQAVKFVFQKADSSIARPQVDNVLGINDPANASTADQWVIFTAAPAFASATSFSLSGDQTATFHTGRRVRTSNTGGTVYSTISGSSYNAGTGRTTVTVSNDFGALDSGISQVSYGLLAASNPALPQQVWSSLLASRAINTNYTNNTGRTITVSASVNGTVATSTLSIAFTVDAVSGISSTSVITGSPAGNTTLSATVVVPAGSTYQCVVTQGSLTRWAELR